jgi:hypothetical protein
VRDRRIGLTALIGEAALRQAHSDPEVMRDQLGALAAVGGQAVVYVLPSRCVPPSSGPATILRFAAVPGLGAVYLPGLSGGACLTGRQDIASHTKAFEQLRTSAQPPAASARLIREIAAARQDQAQSSHGEIALSHAAGLQDLPSLSVACTCFAETSHRLP